MKFIQVMFLATLLFSVLSSADAEFKKTKLHLGKHVLTVELADDPDKRELGLMNRTSLKDTEGMIFIFDYPQPLSFWMKHTLIPLSIGFFDESGKLFQITEMEPASPMDESPRTYNSLKPAKYALEVPQGWFGRKKIPLGTKLVKKDLQ